MRKLLFVSFFFFAAKCFGQFDSVKWLRAFPITSYILDLNDSTKLVQVESDEDAVLGDNQLGIMQGVYKTSLADTVQKGYGRCHLIKGNYYYFTIGHNTNGSSPVEGDLLYTFVKRTAIYYGQIAKLASHFIELEDVHETPFYDTKRVFHEWTASEEKETIDSMVQDIRFTGDYFTRNDPSVDKLIGKGEFKDRKVLAVMNQCRPGYLIAFLDFLIARPRLYAGRKWKISELFATWLAEGAPSVRFD